MPGGRWCDRAQFLAWNCSLPNRTGSKTARAQLIVFELKAGLTRATACTRVLVPEFWTVLGNVNFNFSGLEEQGPLGDFQWGIGTSPGSLDIVPYQTLAGSSIRFTSFKVDTLVSQYRSSSKTEAVHGS